MEAWIAACADGFVLGKQHVGPSEAVEIGKMIDEINQSSALILLLYGTINLAKFPQTHDQSGVRLDMQQ